MKKIVNLIFALCLVFLFTVALASCDNALDATNGFYLDEDTLELTWDRVEGAKSYLVVISGPMEDEQTVRTNKLSLQYLSEGEYEIKVKAISNGVDAVDSEFATYPFERKFETGLKYQLINGDTEYELIGVGTASGDVVMEPEYRGKPITSIAPKALFNNGTITSLVVSADVKTIGEKAFAKSTALKSVLIPEGVTEIGDYAFQSCKALESVSLPSTVTELRPYIFSWCSALTQLKIGDKITKISEYAFSNCTSLTGIKIPEPVTEIGDNCFSDCAALASVEFGSNIKRIGDSAFRNCKALAAVELKIGVEYVGMQAFAHCTSIPSVVLPDTVSEIGAEAFRGCEALATADIGDGVMAFGYNVFLETPFHSNAGDVFCANGWLIEVKNKNVRDFILPAGIYGIASLAFAECDKVESINLSGVRFVGDYAFQSCDALWEVIFDDLETLGVGSFVECKNLITVVLGEKLVSIDDYAFYDCTKLSEMDLPSSLTCIGTYAYANTKIYKDAKSGVIYVDDWAVGIVPGLLNTNIIIKEPTRGIADYAFFLEQVLFSIEIADTVEYIGRGAFLGINTVQFIDLPKNLKSIGDYAFYNCMRAKYGDYGYTEIPAGTEYIGRSAFYENDFIITLKIPSSVKTIGDYAFYGCDYLGGYADDTQVVAGSITIAEGVESIGNRAFQGCINLKTVKIPNSVTYLGSHAFYKCEKLKEATVGEGVSKIERYTFFKCPVLKTVNLSGNVTQIGDCAFSACDALTAVDLNGVESIGRYAFYKCIGMEAVVIPESVKSIGDYAFRGCAGISAPILHQGLTYIGDHAFYGINDATFYCVAESRPDTWNDKFNSAHRPIIWGCTLAEDGSVASIKITEKNPENSTALNGISDPMRSGYSFIGWTTVADGTSVEYTSENLSEAPAGTTLYAIWMADQATDAQ